MHEAESACTIEISILEVKECPICAGGGAQRSARNASGSKPKLPKPPVRMDSMPPPEAKILSVAPPAVSPLAASVAIDPSALLDAHSSHSVAAAAAAPAATGLAAQAASSPVTVQLHKSDSQVLDRAVVGQDKAQVLVANVEGDQHHVHDANNQPRQPASCSPSGLPQLGLTVSPHKLHADADRPLSCLLSKNTSKSGRKSSTPRGSTPRASIGRPPRSGSGPGSVARQDSSASDRKDGRKLMRRNTTG